jgi:hypothetical protein
MRVEDTMFEAMKSVDSRFDGCLADIHIPDALLRDTIKEAPALPATMRDGATLKGGDERLQVAIAAQTAGIHYTLKGCSEVVDDMPKALNDLTTSAVLQMHALSRTYSSVIAEGTGTSAAEADMASILPDIPRDAASLLGQRRPPPSFFREGAGGLVLSGPAATDAADPSSVASAAAAAAVSAVLQKPSAPPTATHTVLSTGTPPIPQQRPPSATPLPRGFSIAAGAPKRPKKPFSDILFGGKNGKPRKEKRKRPRY